MASRKSFLILAAQLAFCAPSIVYFPWAVYLGIGVVIDFLMHGGLAMEVGKGLAFSLGWIGLLGLYSSILIPNAWVQGHALLKFFILIAIVCGFMATLGFFLPPNGLKINDLFEEPFALWVLGGPVVVGVWNLIRIWRPADQELSRK